jgi:hypothetical protein
LSDVSSRFPFIFLGFWLGDGTLDLRRPTGGFDAVSFTQRKESDIAWLRSQLAAVGLVKGSDWREYDLADNCVKFAVFAPSWISLFHTEYQSKYQYLEQCSNELEEYEPWPESDGEPDDTESEDEVEAEADAGMAAWTPPAPELSDARSGVDAAARGVKRDADEIESPADDAAARHPPQPAPAAAAAAAVASSSSGPVPAGGPATVFTPVRQIALDVEAARGGDHAVMYPFAHTYAGPGSYQPYQNAPVRVLYQLHGPRHQLFGRHADGVSVAQTFAVLDAAAGIAGVPLAPGSGHVISELVPIVWDSWHSEEIARLLWDAPRGLGTYAPVARASVQASIRSGAVVIVAFGGHVKERYRELKALDTQVQQILHIGFYPIAVDGRQVWVVECPHPSEPSAQSVVVAAMACAEVLVDGNVPNDETLDRLTKMQRVSAKSAKWLAPWVLTSLTAEEIRLVIQGVWRADGAWAGQKGAIYTSSTSFRDELIIACLHAGYSPYFSLVYLAGTVRGYYLIGDAKHSRVYKASEISGREAEFMPILATKDAWCVHFTPKRKQGAHPHIPRQMIVTEKYEGIVWCVTVEHKDQLVVVQSAEVNEGVVTKASRPVIAGNCRMPQPTWASFNLGIFMCMTWSVQAQGTNDQRF